MQIELLQTDVSFLFIFLLRSLRNLWHFVSWSKKGGRGGQGLLSTSRPHYSVKNPTALRHDQWASCSGRHHSNFLAVPGCFYEPVNVLTHLDLDGSQGELKWWCCRIPLLGAQRGQKGPAHAYSTSLIQKVMHKAFCKRLSRDIQCMIFIHHCFGRNTCWNPNVIHSWMKMKWLRSRKKGNTGCNVGCKRMEMLLWFLPFRGFFSVSLRSTLLSIDDKGSIFYHDWPQISC